jgi:hypothetical protein
MKWVAIALALLLLASGIFWLGRNSMPADTPAAQTKAQPAKPAAPAPVQAPPDTQAGAPDGAPMDAAPAPQEAQPAPPPPSTPSRPRPKTLAELDTGTLIQRAISADDRCSNGQGSLDQTGQACAMRDRIEAILNARGFCHSGGSADWQRCAQ